MGSIEQRMRDHQENETAAAVVVVDTLGGS